MLSFGDIPKIRKKVKEMIMMNKTEVITDYCKKGLVFSYSKKLEVMWRNVLVFLLHLIIA